MSEPYTDEQILKMAPLMILDGTGIMAKMPYINNGEGPMAFISWHDVDELRSKVSSGATWVPR